MYDLKHNPFLFYEWPTLEHIHRLFYETLYGEWLLNTAFVGVLVVMITLALAVPAGYALARLTGNWGAKLGIGIFLTYLVPPTLLFIPLSRVVVNLKSRRFALVARVGLSILHSAVLRVADDGLFQSDPKRTSKKPP